MRYRAFTLLESLLVVALIGVLASILVPVLLNSRRAGAAATDLSNMRQTMVDFFSYAASSRDEVANAGTPFEERSRFYYKESWGTDAGWSWYRSQHGQWPRVLARLMEPSRHWYAVDEDFILDEGPDFVREGAGGVVVTPALLEGWYSTYELGDTMRLAARAFGFPRATATPQTAVQDFAVCVHFHEIALPSRKGVLLQRNWWGEDQGLAHVAFADGSASARQLSESQPAAARPTSSAVDKRGRPVDCTVHGHLGFDW